MLYPTCPTCNTLFADKVLEYEKRTKAGEKVEKVLNDLNIMRMCCRMRVMSYVDLTEILL